MFGGNATNVRIEYLVGNSKTIDIYGFAISLEWDRIMKNFEIYYKCSSQNEHIFCGISKDVTQTIANISIFINS